MSEHAPYSRVEYRKLIAWPERIRREWPLLEEVLSIGPSRRVVELGCGPDQHARALAEAGFEVVGIDRSEAMIADATEPARTTRTSELIKIEDVWSDDFSHLLVEDGGSGEKLFLFVSLVTPSGVRLDGAQCIGRLAFGDEFGGFIQTTSDNGTCTLRDEPADGIVPRGPATFELLDVNSPGKTHTPERSDVNPAKFDVR